MNNGVDNLVETLRVLLTGLANLDGAEVIVRHTKALKLEAKDYALESSVSSENVGVGVKLLKAGQAAQSYSSATEAAALKDMLNRCEKMLEVAPVDKNILIAPFSYHGASTHVQYVDNTFSLIPTEEKIQRLFNLEANVLKVDAAIKRTRNTQYLEAYSREWIWTMGSKRVLSTDRSWAHISTTAVAERGADSQIGEDSDSQTQYYNLDWGTVARNAGSFAAKMLGAAPIASGEYNVLFSNRVMTDLLGLLSVAFSGDSVSRGLSFLGNDCGKAVFSKQLNILDDPHQSKALGSSLWDAEGTATQKVSFVAEGVVQGFAHNLRSAARAQTQSTGHGVRSSERSAVDVGFHNLCIEPGAKDYVDLIREMGRGLVIYRLLGVHTANPISGEFSFGASGMWIENGVEQRPVSGIAVAGDLKSLFARVGLVGRDIRWDGNLGSPSLVFENVSVSGE